MQLLRASLLTVFLVASGLSGLSAQSPPELVNDTEFRPIARQAVDSLYNFNPKAARQLLEPWKQRYPDHPLWTLFDGIELWWQILADLQDTSHDDEFFNLMGRADYEAGRLLSKQRNHVDALIIKAISNGYIGRQLANRNEWLRSVNEARKAFSAYQYLMEVQPGLPDLEMAEGLKLYYAEYLPEAYPIVKTVSWFLPDGNKEKGLELLEQAADSSIFAQAEARYFLGNINLVYEKNYDVANRHLSQLYESYPNNNYYARILARSYYEMNEFNKALNLIDRALERWEAKDLEFKEVLREELLTWKGRIYYRRYQREAAIPVLEEAFKIGLKLDNPKSRSQHVISGYYLGRIYLERGEESEARHYLQAVAEMEAEEEYREHARELLEDKL